MMIESMLAVQKLDSSKMMTYMERYSRKARAYINTGIDNMMV
jgi:hypothetical protein